MHTPAKSRRANPDYCFARIEDIRLDWIAEHGFRGILLDIDNTLTRWEHLEVPAGVMAWLHALRGAGLPVRLISNGLAHKRVAVSRQTGVPLVGGYLFKPVPAFFRRGVAELGCPPQTTLMIGDSVLTDIAIANRCGIWTALVDPLSPVDFVGSKLGRFIEHACRLRDAHTPRGDFRAGPFAGAPKPPDAAPDQ